MGEKEDTWTLFLQHFLRLLHGLILEINTINDEKTFEKIKRLEKFKSYSRLKVKLFCGHIQTQPVLVSKTFCMNPTIN